LSKEDRRGEVNPAAILAGFTPWPDLAMVAQAGRGLKDAGMTSATPDVPGQAAKAGLDRAQDLIFAQDQPEAGLAAMDALGAVARDNGRALVLRAAAFAKLGRAAEMDAVLGRALARPQPQVRDMLRRMLLRLFAAKRLPTTALALEAIWGTPGADLRDTILATRPFDMPPHQRDGLQWTLDHLPPDRRPLADYPLERAWEGRLRSEMFGFISNASPDDPGVVQYVGASDPAAAVMGLIEAPDLTLFRPLVGTDDTVIVLQMHGGVGLAVGTSLEHLPVPVSLIRNGDGLPEETVQGMRAGSRPGDYHIVADAEDLAMRFTRLCQLMRKGARVVHVFPDGAQGGSFAEAEIAGHRVQIGLGAASLAFYGKSRFVFGRSRWTERGVTVEFTPGPKVNPGDSKAEVEAMMVAFYADCVTEVLRGDPIDFGLRGGFWRQFTGVGAE
jgi:hypothetical protein